MKIKNEPCVIEKYLEQSIDTVKHVRNSSSVLLRMTSCIAEAVSEQRTVFLCGNGGSFSMAQHFAAEMSGKFEADRSGFRAHTLGSNGATLTALSNDFGYNHVFARELTAQSKTGDVLIAMSTSGTSSNIVMALETAKDLDIKCLGFTGVGEAKFKRLCDVVFEASSERTAFVQEAHLVALHAICAKLDSVFSS
ncbi:MULTISPECIES: SIS domain-containing protein [unclassified Ruegeria]|uniref:D-sedoheptulose-7-phosphate isomerase n=1 Tax=unclassified Ruegeria TaxID=2625375 RepID=UPI00148776CD|nr:MULTISPECIES: SIS domain-containing protein [unclassified Ruegeria]NOD85905.1 SIS domain-containing protein [Ruegeria sp. HKCCD6119]